MKNNITTSGLTAPFTIQEYSLGYFCVEKPCLQQGCLTPNKNGSKKVTYKNLLRNSSVPSRILRASVVKSNPLFTFYFLLFTFALALTLCHSVADATSSDAIGNLFLTPQLYTFTTLHLNDFTTQRLYNSTLPSTLPLPLPSTTKAAPRRTAHKNIL